jgi:hypothetical protein
MAGASAGPYRSMGKLRHTQSLNNISFTSNPQTNYWSPVEKVRQSFDFFRSAAPSFRYKSAAPPSQPQIQRQPTVVLYVDEVCSFLPHLYPILKYQI